MAIPVIASSITDTTEGTTNTTVILTEPAGLAVGDLIVLLGVFKEEIGGSEYLLNVYGKEEGMPPELNTKLEKSVVDTCMEAIKHGIIESAHDCSEGGISVALAESCISGSVGARIDIKNPHNLRPDVLLFGESQSRIVVSLKEEELPKLNKLAEKNKAPMEILGKVPVKEMFSAMRELKDANTLVFDGDIDQKLINQCSMNSIKYIVGMKAARIRTPEGITTVTLQNLK